MILTIDIGNTNVVFGTFKEDHLLQQWRLPTAFLREGDDDNKVKNDQHSSGLFSAAYSGIESVIIASVVPDVEDYIRKACEQDLGITPLFVTYENAGIEVTLNQASQVGADRLVNVASVTAYYQTPAIVIDFGTATTFDVITADNQYAGGVIAPGIQLSLETLVQKTAKLSEIRIKKPPHAIGKTTGEAMQSGIFYGYLGLIEGVVQNLSAEMQARPKVIATGGLARLFFDETDVIQHLDPDLTLKGLLSVYKTILNK